MDNLYLLDIEAFPKGQAESFLARQPCIQHVFEVQGEKRVIAVVKGEVSELSEALNSSVVHCTPLIPFQQFASQTLNVQDKDVEKKGTTPAFLPGKDLYWLRFSVGYERRTQEELLKAMHDEALFALRLMHGGEVPVALYKGVAMREIHLFIQMEATALDHVSFELPIVKALGDQVNIVTKAVRFLQNCPQFDVADSVSRVRRKE